MLTEATRAILDVDRLRDEIRILLGPTDGGLLGSEEPKPKVSEQPEDKKQVDQMRKDLIKVLREIDSRLLTALNNNKLSLNARYALLAVLGALFVVAVGYAFVDRNVAVGVAGLLPVAPAPWILRNLRSLQDERIWLMMRLKKYEPRVVVCVTLACLQSLAQEISGDLERLNTPVTADAKAVTSPPPPPPA